MKHTNVKVETYRVASDLPVVSPRSTRGLSFRWNRRQLLRRAFGGAVALGLVSLSYVPPARRAYASHSGNFGYRIKQNCPGANEDDQCNPGCSPSPVCGGMSDGPCCVESGHKEGWHKANGCEWKLRPGECTNDGTKDGWKWSQGSCGVCDQGLTYRCHDGFACNANCGSCDNRICRHVTFCNFS